MKRVKMMLNGGTVTRFHTGVTVREQTVGQHTFNMLVFLDQVYYGTQPDHMMRAVLYHDLHEVFTGDIPWPMKQRADMAEVTHKVETEINREYGLVVELNNEEWHILKALDMLEFCYYMKQEAILGNTNNLEARKRAKQEAIKAIDACEDKWGELHLLMEDLEL